MGQIICYKISEPIRYCSIGMGGTYIGGMHSGISPKSKVAEFIAYHQAFGKINGWKIIFRPESHAGVGFAARAVIIHVGAKIHGIYFASCIFYFKGKVFMDGFYIFL